LQLYTKLFLGTDRYSIRRNPYSFPTVGNRSFLNHRKLGLGNCSSWWGNQYRVGLTVGVIESLRKIILSQSVYPCQNFTLKVCFFYLKKKPNTKSNHII